MPRFTPEVLTPALTAPVWTSPDTPWASESAVSVLLLALPFRGALRHARERGSCSPSPRAVPRTPSQSLLSDIRAASPSS